MNLIKFPSPPTHRPWKIGEVPIGKIVRNHGSIGTKDEGRYLIIGSDKDGVMLLGDTISFKDMLEFYKMDNGEPCGIKLMTAGTTNDFTGR